MNNDDLYDLTKAINNLTATLDQGFGEIQHRLDGLSRAIEDISIPDNEERLMRVSQGLFGLMSAIDSLVELIDEKE